MTHGTTAGRAGSRRALTPGENPYPPGMRLRFLGTGTSAGVPPIGMDPATDDPRDVRLRTSASLSFTDPDGKPRTILIDAGPDLRQQALAARMTRCDSLLITHHHVDHCWGMDELRRFNILMDAPIYMYTSRYTLDRLRTVYQHIFEPEKNQQASFVASVIPTAVEPFVPFELYGLRITPIELRHGRVPILGFRFDPADDSVKGVTIGQRRGGRRVSTGGILPLAYCTDVSSIPTDTWPYLTGSDEGRTGLGPLSTLVLDGLRKRKHPTHFAIGESVRVAERVEASQTWLVHMSQEVQHERDDAELPDGVNLAYDGLEIGEAAHDDPVADRGADVSGSW